MNGRVGHLDDAILAVEAVGGTSDAFLESRRRQDDLERGAGLEGIGDRAVAPLIVRRRREGVRIEGGADGERQDLARARIHQDGHGGLRAGPSPGRLHLPFGDVLERGVDGQHHPLAGDGRLEHRRGPSHLAVRVATDEGLPLHARQQRVPGLLHARQPLAVDALEADGVGGQLTVRVEAQALRDEAEGRLLEIANGLGKLAVDRVARPAVSHNSFQVGPDR